MPEEKSKSDLDTLFKPKGIAVIGVSISDDSAMGRIIFDNLRGRGDVYGVNPKVKEKKDFFKDVRDIPADIDLAVIAVSADNVQGAVEGCVSKGVKNIVIIAGGFEGSKKGKNSGEGIKRIIKGSDTRSLGPNTMGIYCPSSDLDTLFVKDDIIKRPRDGDIAFVSQSGFLSLPFLDTLHEHHHGIHSFIGIGDRYDINENELLRYLLEEENVKVVSLYLENFVNGREFYEIAKDAGEEKGIVLLKGGTSERGKKAVISHTGSIAEESKKVVEGLAEQTGIVLADDERELVYLSEALEYYGNIEGGNVAIMSSAGGMGIIAADHIEEHADNLEACEVSERTRKRIDQSIDDLGSPRNPIDLTPAVTGKQYDDVLKALNEDEGVDSIILYLSRSPATDDGCLDTVLKWHKDGDRPLMVVLHGGENAQKWRRRLWDEGVPTYPNTSRAVGTLDKLVKRGAILAKKGLTDEEES